MTRKLTVELDLEELAALVDLCESIIAERNRYSLVTASMTARLKGVLLNERSKAD